MSIFSTINQFKNQSASFSLIPFKNTLQPYLVLVTIVFVLYANTFNHEIAYDDRNVISQNEFVIKGVKGIPEILTHDTYYSYYKQLGLENSLPGGRYRPLSTITYAIEQEFIATIPDGIVTEASWDVNQNGRVEQAEDVNNDSLFNKYDFYIKGAAFRHIVNVLLYALVVVLIYFFFSNYLFKNFQDMIFISVLIFAVHPIHTEVVANIKSRDEILSLLFIFLTSIYVFKYIDFNSNRNLFYVFLYMFLALMSKEYGIMLFILLPFLIFIHNKELLKIKQSGIIIHIIIFAVTLFLLKIGNNFLTLFLVFTAFCSYSFIRGFKSDFLINRLFFALANAVCLYFLFRFFSTSNSISSSVAFKNDILGNPYLFASFQEEWASKIVVCLRYLKLMLVPYPLLADYSYDTIPYSDFSSPLFWLTIFIYAGLISFTIYSLIKRSTWSIGLLFFILFFIPVANLFFDIGATMGERLFFHSSIGICIFISMILFAVINKLKLQPKRALIFILIVFGAQSVAYSYLTIKRNPDWKNNTTLFTRDVKFAPKNVNALLAAGTACYEDALIPKNKEKKIALLKKSIELFNNGIKIYPNHFPLYINKSLSFYYLEELDSSLACTDIVMKISPQLPLLKSVRLKLADKFMLKGISEFEKGDKKSGLNYLVKALSVDKTSEKAWNNLAKALYELGAKDKALACYQSVLKINPKNKIALDGIEKIKTDLK